jgi:hypothetical protein
VLLQPELLDAYASSLINAAKEDPDGLGSISEEDVQRGNFRMPEDERIFDREQERLLLLATIEDLLRHQIVQREPSDAGMRLVFPSQLTREHPALTEPFERTVAFLFEGPVLTIYATLAVRLSHSGAFKKREMWKNAASYTAQVGGVCGMHVQEVEGGRGELSLFFDPTTSEEIRFLFEEYIHSHLQRRAEAHSSAQQTHGEAVQLDCDGRLLVQSRCRRDQRQHDAWWPCARPAPTRAAYSRSAAPPKTSAPSSSMRPPQRRETARPSGASLVASRRSSTRATRSRSPAAAARTVQRAARASPGAAAWSR